MNDRQPYRSRLRRPPRNTQRTTHESTFYPPSAEEIAEANRVKAENKQRLAEAMRQWREGDSR